MKDRNLEYLTPEQLAVKLQLHVGVVRRMLAAGKLPGRRVGRVWRTSEADLRAFMATHDNKILPRAE